MISDKKLAEIVPHKRQIKFQQTEFYAFVHFTVNTFTDLEWGSGTESPEIFGPVKLDAEQWVKAVVSAGMKGLILTCKHHDGFCLWHSRLTEHTVEHSPFGRDIVREVSDACRKYGIKFGVYLSPWDRHSPLYGSGKDYDDYFIGQLTELLTNYGEVFSVWFDGACGEGPNGKKQYYDWDRYYKTIRVLQPDTCINVCGPDVRWCGNEAGHTRKSEWSVVPARTRDTEKIAGNSQQEDNDKFRQRKISALDADLGSREILENESELIWYPAEVNTSIRPGWFWHKSENDKVRPLDELINIYYNSVGANSTFLLNIPPTNEGLFHKNDVKRLAEIGEYLSKAFAENIISQAYVSYNGSDIKSKILADSYDDFFIADTVTAVITVKWDASESIGNIILKENITKSQRVEHFEIEALINGSFKKIYENTVIGYKRIIRLDKIKTDCLRINITDSRTEPTISFIGIYKGE
ncbi:MAG: alpha-L-fucosidase [Oscillospiraceae bacterium]|nr:alpha-L-fucosidase [Oscillospiraceae bacterium]MDY6207525.1 alpha-L-fucosidase [Oscillospiraceae bacterium]